MLSLLPPLVVALAVGIIVWPGLMPDVGFWDTGEFQTVLPILGTAHPTGYPTYVLFGFVANLLLTPLGEPAFRINVLSLLCVATAAGVTVSLVTRLTGFRSVAVASGLAVALSPFVWRLATHAEPHTLHLALVATLLLLLVRWEGARRAGLASADRWLVAAAVTFGLAAGNHSLTLLLAFPVGLYVLAVQPEILFRPRFVAVCGLALVGTLAAVYLELPLRAGLLRAPLVYGKPETWDGFWYIALAEQFRGALHDPLGDLPRKMADLATLTVGQFGLLAPLVPLGFLATAVRRWRYALLTGAATLITVLFSAAYVNADISRYYLGPILMAWTWLGILAAMIIEALLGYAGITSGDAQPGSASPLAASGSSTLVALGLSAALLVPTAADFSSRARQADLSDDTSARSWVTAVLGELEPGAVVISSWSTSTVLWYALYVDEERPDVTVVDDRTRLDLDYGEVTDVITRFYGQRPVYVIRATSQDLSLIMGRYDLKPLGSLPDSDVVALSVYQVVGPRASGG